jgi:hypothetical protein
MTTGHVREAVGAFTSAVALEAAVDELLRAGFGRADLSVLATGKAIEAKLGHAVTSTRELEDDARVPTVAYVARESIGDAESAVLGGFLYVGALAGMLPILATGGAVAAALVATVAGGAAGAAVGGVLADMIGRSHADHLAEHLERGGLLLWVRTHDLQHEKKATAILERHGGQDVHVHGIPDARAKLVEHYTAQRTREGVFHEPYAGEDIVHMPDGHCFAAGRVFPAAAAARRYLDGFAQET